MVSDETYAYINFLQISYGAVIRSFTLEVKKKLEETDVEILRLAIIDLKQRFSSESKEVIVPFEINKSPFLIDLVSDDRPLTKILPNGFGQLSIRFFNNMIVVKINFIYG